MKVKDAEVATMKAKDVVLQSNPATEEKVTVMVGVMAAIMMEIGGAWET